MVMVNIIKEQEARYIFASKIVTGKVLVISQNKFMAYHGAKILLDSNVNEVWNYDFSDPDHVDVRRYHDKNIQFTNFDVNIFDEKFDSIILFDSAYTIDSVSLNMEKFSKSLNDNGIFMTSMNFNKPDSLFFINNKNIKKTKYHVNKILTKKFTDITFYSQLLTTKKNILVPYLAVFSFVQKSIRSILGTFLLKLDKKSVFYQACLLKVMLKVDDSLEILDKGLSSNEYDPINFEENHQPTYFIIVCKR